MSTNHGDNPDRDALAGGRTTTPGCGGRADQTEALVTSDGAVWTWGELVEEFGPAVHSYARARGVADAEDVVQDVFTAVVQKLPTFCGSSAALRSFVFTLAFRRVADRHRRAYRHERLWREPAVLVEEPVESVLDHDDGARAIAALDRLDDRSQAVLRLRYIDGRDVAEVAALMNLSATNVRAIQSRALKRLRGRFNGLRAGVRQGSLAVFAWSSPIVMRQRLGPASGAWTRRWGGLRRVRERMAGSAYSLAEAGVGAAGGASLIAAVSLTAASILGAGDSTATARVAGIEVVRPQQSSPTGTSPQADSPAAESLPVLRQPGPAVGTMPAAPVSAGTPLRPADAGHEPADRAPERDLADGYSPPDDPQDDQVPGPSGVGALAGRVPADDVLAVPVEVVDRFGSGALAASTDALTTPVTDLVAATAAETIAATIDLSGAQPAPADSTVTAASTPAPAAPGVGLPVIDVPVAADQRLLGDAAVTD